MNLTTHIEDERKKTIQAVEPWLKQKLNRYAQVHPTYAQFLAPLEAYLMTGGKWGRPLLCRLAYEQVTGKSAASFYLASGALEIFHRFILCHDDIIDQDQHRHGIETLEHYFSCEQAQLAPPHPVVLFGKGMAIVSGDLIHSLTMEMILESGVDNKISVQVIRGLHSCLVETLAGWHLETRLKQQTIATVTKEQVSKAMELVSAQYSVVWPLRFGQLFAGGELGIWDKRLEEYGRNVGMAFQIQDDLLGIFGKTERTGKPVGNDLREGKKSLVLLEGYKRGTKKQKEILEAVHGEAISQKQLKEVQEILQKTGAVSWAKQEAQKLVKNSVEALEMDLDHDLKKAAAKLLVNLAYFLADRDR